MTKTLSYLDLLGMYQRDLEEHWFPCPSLAFSLCEVTGQPGHVPTTPRSRKKKRDAVSWELHGALSPPHCCPLSSTAHPHPVTGALPSRLFFPLGGRNPCLPVLSFWNFYFKLVDKKFVSLQHAQTYFAVVHPPPSLQFQLPAWGFHPCVLLSSFSTLLTSPTPTRTVVCRKIDASLSESGSPCLKE